MPRRLLAAILVLIAAPLAILGWLSVQTLRNDSVVAKQQLELLLEQRLRESQQPIVAVFDQYQRSLSSQFLEAPADRLRVLRDLERFNPIVNACLLIQPNGQLVHPTKPITEQPSEQSEFATLVALAASRNLTNSTDESTTEQVNTRIANVKSTEPQPSLLLKPAWQTWYMHQGTQLVLWFPQTDGSLVGVLLERSRWVADVISALPQSQSAQTASQTKQAMAGYSTLVDEQQRTIYRWGDSEPKEIAAIAEVDTVAPLRTWKIRFHGDIRSLIPNSATNAIVWSTLATMTVLASVGAYVVSATRRQMNLAKDHVSFAGNVSHELRTPLTNIRLYADLAKRDVEDVQDESLQQQLSSRLDVIAHESERLSGLVSGVLDFMRSDAEQRPPRYRELVPDQLLDEIIASFEPSFDAAGIKLDRSRGAGDRVSIDPDICRIIVVNLLSNVQKYAATGEYCCVESRLADGCLFIRVRDRGPGIASRHRRYVFKPFTRLNNDIDAPSGTGIGLSIALAAAKRCGGDLMIESGDGTGAAFLVKLPIATKS